MQFSDARSTWVTISIRPLNSISCDCPNPARRIPPAARAARLRESLAAYDEALRFRRPDTAPLAYATTQSNLANFSMNLADLPGEDRRGRWQEAIRYAVTALSLFLQLQHEPYAKHVARQLHWIEEQCGETFPELWAELNIGELPE